MKSRWFFGEPLISGARNRILQSLAMSAPGSETLRVKLHRMRGIKIGSPCFIGQHALIETSHPELVTIGDGVAIGIRATIIAHFRDQARGDGVVIETEASIGPGAIIMPNVTIGYGAVVAAGSVVTSSVAPLTFVQGNPAKPIARCGVPLGLKTPYKEFAQRLKPL
jgi:acetyltransferase-like isoleucine patch superfamily enzyme